jgi:hypothetical protein
MRTFRPAAPASTSQTQPARNPCRAHNDVRGDRPVRQLRRRPGSTKPASTSVCSAASFSAVTGARATRRSRTAARLKPGPPRLHSASKTNDPDDIPSEIPSSLSDGRTRIDRVTRPRYWVYRGTGGLRELWGYLKVRFPWPPGGRPIGRNGHVVCELAEVGLGLRARRMGLRHRDLHPVQAELDRRRATSRDTVTSAHVAPCSATSRCQTGRAVCRCLHGTSRPRKQPGVDHLHVRIDRRPRPPRIRLTWRRDRAGQRLAHRAPVHVTVLGQLPGPTVGQPACHV